MWYMNLVYLGTLISLSIVKFSTGGVQLSKLGTLMQD